MERKQNIMEVNTVIEKECRICNRCVMDGSDPDIVFDDEGVCNHCRRWFERRPTYNKTLEQLISDIYSTATGEYNAILGVSGGVDSCYAAYLMDKLNMKDILLVHMSDGWDTKEAKHNWRVTIANTDYDHKEVRLDEAEFNDIILSYLRAGVQGLEVPTDNCIMTAINCVMDEFKINNVISGSNWATEGIAPRAWEYPPSDARNLKAIHKKFGTTPLKNIRPMGSLKKHWRFSIGGKKEFRVLNYTKYHREEAKQTLAKEWSWRDYGYGRKHQESHLTRLVEGYIFPVKFGFDKRRSHFSALVCSGQMTRAQALELLEQPPYIGEDLRYDIEFALAKLRISRDEFNSFMNRPIRSHLEFPTHIWSMRLLKLLGPIRRRFR